MSEIIKTNAEYSKWIKEVSLRFRNSQIKAATKVNREMLLFYWSIGHDISENYNEIKYGKSFFKNLMTLLGFTGIGSVDFMAAGFTLPLNFLAFVTGISLFPVCK